LPDVLIRRKGADGKRGRERERAGGRQNEKMKEEREARPTGRRGQREKERPKGEDAGVQWQREAFSL